MNRTAAAAFAALTLLLPIAACSKNTAPSVPTLNGTDATLIAQVDCGETGVAGVTIEFGDLDDEYLVGRPPLTQAVGGIEALDRRYGISDGYQDVMFTIATDPTTGTCTTVLTDADSGDVLAEKSSAGTARLEVMVTGRD